MKNNIIAFLAGALTALLIYLKKKHPDVVNVSGDLIEEQKIKDNRKVKNIGLTFSDGQSVDMISAQMSRREVIRIWKSLKR